MGLGYEYPPANLRNDFVKYSNIKTNGYIMYVNASKTPLNLNDIFAGFTLAYNFGSISPKIRITKVIIPIAIPTP